MGIAGAKTGIAGVETGIAGAKTGIAGATTRRKALIVLNILGIDSLKTLKRL
jgi:hypothetical protein